jgi:hypothetical protein
VLVLNRTNEPVKCRALVAGLQREFGNSLNEAPHGVIWLKVRSGVAISGVHEPKGLDGSAMLCAVNITSDAPSAGFGF